MNQFFQVVLIFIFCKMSLVPAENLQDMQSKQQIIGLLMQWPKDFNAKNTKAVCGLFAEDVIASYPGIEDRNFQDMCRQFSLALKDPEKKYHYATPEIEQIFIEGDLAVVRLIWTLTVTSSLEVKTIKEKGLDVLRRQKDGKWKIAVSYAHPI